jgi:hypothetical protein
MDGAQSPALTMVGSLKMIEKEIAELEALLQDGTLYKPVKALYHKPSDLTAFLEQQKYHDEVFGQKLKSVLKSRAQKAYRLEMERREAYQKAYESWSKKVRREEQNNGEEHHWDGLPPKQHPSLIPSQPQNQPLVIGGSRSRSRSSISGDVVRSEAELNQVLLSLLEQERENPATRWMSTLAICPPMNATNPFDNPNVSTLYIDENGYLPPSIPLTMPTTEMVSDSGHAYSCVWTPEEERIFVEKYMHFPKNFPKIASFLGPSKSTKDCVQFYYRSKKKLLLRSKLSTYKKSSNSENVGSFIAGGGTRKRVGRPPRAQPQTTEMIREESEEDDSGNAMAIDEDGIIDDL